MGQENSTVEQIISDFLSLRYKSDAFEQTLNLSLSQPEQLPQLFEIGLDKVPLGATFFNVAMSYIPEHAFPDVVNMAVKKLPDSPDNNLAESVIAYTSLQFLRFLHPHLETIFDLEANKGSYYENYSWRESETLNLKFLTSVIQNQKQTRTIKEKAFECLLETRNLTVLQIALTLYPKLNLRHRLSLYLEQVGVEWADNKFRQLYNPAVYHLSFDKSYFEESNRPYYGSKTIHPTWRLDDELVQTCKFGGTIDNKCSMCKGRLHRVVTFDSIFDDLPVRRLQKLILATCLSCLGWEEHELFYRHGTDGEPVAFDYVGERKIPEFPAEGFNETTIKVVRTPERWRWQDWGLSNGRENLHRVGGSPCWVQSAEYPLCPDCNRKMIFLLQLDSELPTSDDSEWLWGSGGICYCFWCDDCQVSGFLWQCT